MAPLVLAWMTCAPLGCAGVAERRAPNPAQIVADWDDVDAAVDVAAERSEMALIEATEPTGDGLIRRFVLRTVAAEPVLLIVTRPPPVPGGEDQPQPLTARVKVGRFGSPDREARFLGHLQRRLEQLRGVDASPL